MGGYRAGCTVFENNTVIYISYIFSIDNLIDWALCYIQQHDSKNFVIFSDFTFSEVFDQECTL